jgi:hypothetical protein
MAKKSTTNTAEVGPACRADRTSQRDSPTTRLKPPSLPYIRVIYCGDTLRQLAKLPNACVELIYIEPPFNSNRNEEVFWGER